MDAGLEDVDLGDPGESRTTTEFVEALARRRLAAAETYQSLQTRTGVPRSTLADMLSLQRKPRSEDVLAVVRAYARDPAQADAWTRTWRRLLADGSPGDQGGVAQGTAALTQPEPRGASAADSAPSSSAHRPRPARTTPRLKSRAVGVAALMIASGSVLLVHSRLATGSGAGPTSSPAVTLTVFNVEQPCQPLRTIECALGIMRDPRLPLAAANRIARVWHGEHLTTDCAVPGRVVTDEQGMSSDRWYHVTVPGTKASGWFPGVRTRNTTAVPACPGPVG
jgi:hypothetical protein